MTTYTDLFGQNTVPPADAGYFAVSISANSFLSWENNFVGQTNELLAATLVDLTPTVAGLSVLLPSAAEVSTGTELLIKNSGANVLNILNNAGSSIASVDPGVIKYFMVTSNTTAAGVWTVFTFGTGTSGADASMLAGQGLRVIASKLSCEVAYQPVNSNYTVQELNRASVIDAATGVAVLTLPLAGSMSQGFYTMLRNSSTGNVTITPSGSDLIDGASSKVLSPNESLILVCTGSSWISVGFGRDVTFVFGEVVVNAASTTITLTSADVAGRMIRVSGTATANVTINLPPVDNIYFINIESGVGVFSVTLTTGSGITTTLNANQRTVVYCDGTNVSPAITTTVTSSLALVDGNPAAPSIAWALDSDTGFYRSSNGVAGFASNGVSTILFGPNGIVFASTQGLTSNNLASACDELKVLLDSLTTSITTGLAGKADKSGAAFTGPVTVPAGATGSQVPRVSEVTSAISSSLATAQAYTDTAVSGLATAASVALKANKAGDVFTGPVRFDTEYDNGNSGTAKTIDFSNGQKQKITFTGNCTLTLSFPSGVGNYVLRGIGNGTTYTLTWPGSAKFASGIAPLGPLTSGTAIYTIYYDGAVAHIAGARE